MNTNREIMLAIDALFDAVAAHYPDWAIPEVTVTIGDNVYRGIPSPDIEKQVWRELEAR